MTRYYLSLIISSILITFIIAGCSPSADIEQEKTAVEGVLEQYLEAVKARDKDMITAIMANDPWLVAISPYKGASTFGWDAFQQRMAHYFDDESFQYLDHSLETHAISIAASGVIRATNAHARAAPMNADTTKASVPASERSARPSSPGFPIRRPTRCPRRASTA